jgi:hypothetical protein
MKLVTLALIALSTTAAIAQSNLKKSPVIDLNLLPDAQAGCPVAFTEVSLTNPGHLMLVQQGTNHNNSLEFQYKNQSGKLIESIEIRVELKVKRSVYDLDATTITRDMTLTHDAEETLPLNLLVYSVGRVTLEQVNYIGGKVWIPKDRSVCNYEQLRGSEQIAR